MSESPTLDELLAQAGWVRALARRLARGAEADDLEQETWLAVLRRPPHALADARAWLARVLANRATSAARADERRTRRERAVAAAEALPATGELLGALDEQARIAAAVRALEEPYRSTLLLHFYSGLSPSAIARRAGVPPGTVRSRLKRGLDLLRERFDREHGGDRRAWSLACAVWAEREELALGGAALAVASTVFLALAGGGSWLAWRALRDEPVEPALVSAHVPRMATSDVAQAPTRPSDGARTTTREESATTPPSALVTGTRYHGHVFAPDRTPVVGAALTLVRASQSEPRRLLATGATDEQGRFEFIVEEQDAAPVLRLSTAGFLPREQGLAPERENALRLSWSVEVRGSVRSKADGRPLVGARVQGREHQTVTDSAGAFRLSGFPSEERSSLSVAAPGFIPLAVEPFLRGPEAHTLTLELAPAQEFTCAVVERESGRPLAGATLRAFESEGPLIATTDESGRASVPFAPGETLELRIAHAECFEGYWKWTPAPGEPPPSPAFPLRRRRWIEGRVLDAAGAPLAGAWVYATSDATFGSSESAERLARLGVPGEFLVFKDARDSRTDAAGGFRAECFAAEQPWWIETGAPGRLWEKSGPIVVSETGPDPAGLEFRLSPAAELHGHALEGGRPYLGFLAWQDPQGQRLATAIAQDGCFTFSDLPAGEGTLVVLDENDEAVHPEAPRIPLTLRAGERQKQDVTWGAEWIAMQGYVRGTHGEGLQDASVFAWSADSGRCFGGVDVDASGAFTLFTPPDVEVRLTADRGGPDERAHWTGPAGSHDIELVLAARSFLRLRVLEEESRLPVQANRHTALHAVRWTRSDGTSGRANADLDPGGLLVLELAPGVYDVSLYLEGSAYRPGRLQGLVLAPDESREHELLLTRGLDRFVRLDPSPSAADGFGEHLVFLVHEDQLASIAGPYPEQGPPSNRRINGLCMRLDDPTLMEQLLSRDDFASTGKTRLFGLKPGRYVLESYPDDYLFEPPTLELSPTSPDELVFRWRRR